MHDHELNFNEFVIKVKVNSHIILEMQDFFIKDILLLINSYF